MPDLEAAQLIAAARSCLGTPFKHQGRRPQLGLDCVGLVRHPAVVVGLISADADYTHYSRTPNPDKMRRELLNYFYEVPIKELLPGDVLWLKVLNDPQHLALYTDSNTIIHAVSSGPRCVVEHGFRPPWPSRVKAVFRYVRRSASL